MLREGGIEVERLIERIEVREIGRYINRDREVERKRGIKEERRVREEGGRRMGIDRKKGGGRGIWRIIDKGKGKDE